MLKPITPFRRRAWLAAAGALALVTLGAGAGQASAQSSAVGSASLAGVTGVGIHNTYDDKTDYTYLADALDTGASLIELDTWANCRERRVERKPRRPAGQQQQLRPGHHVREPLHRERNKNLNSCLDDIRVWMLAHPAHGPVMVKIEMKNGFDDGPAWTRRNSTPT